MLLLSLLSMPPSSSLFSSSPPTLHDPPTRWGSGTCDWRRRAGSVVIAPVPIHQWTWALYSASHLRRGQFLHLQTRLGEKKLKEFAFSPFASSPHFFSQTPAATSRTSSSVFLLRSLRPWFLGISFFLARKKEVSALDLHIFFFGEEACGLCSIIWSVGFPLLRQKHGSTNLQNRWKRGSCGRKAGRRRGCCGEVERTGKRDVLIVRVLIAGAEFCLGFCCVNGVLHVSPCKRIPTLTGFSGKVATCTRFSPACALFQIWCFSAAKRCFN